MGGNCSGTDGDKDAVAEAIYASAKNRLDHHLHEALATTTGTRETVENVQSRGHR